MVGISVNIMSNDKNRDKKNDSLNGKATLVDAFNCLPKSKQESKEDKKKTYSRRLPEIERTNRRNEKPPNHKKLDDAPSFMTIEIGIFMMEDHDHQTEWVFKNTQHYS